MNSTSCYDTPNIVYNETLGDVMAPVCPQRDPPLHTMDHHIEFSATIQVK